MMNHSERYVNRSERQLESNVFSSSKMLNMLTNMCYSGYGVITSSQIGGSLLGNSMGLSCPC